ncbi:MAG: putative DNA binding domain-containing protein, partial [Desulfobacterales bacterium]|nr:putative DNA binding domain-containing protein [Desulfobacterales bacterium]
MDTNEHQLLGMIRQGEGIATEFKKCRNRLSRDVYETVCAFLNRHGGTILLGVTDSGGIQGIEQDAVAQIKKDFVTATNNPQKIYPPAYLSVDEVTVKGKPVLRVYVPESSQVHRCNGRIYDRNEDGDLVRTNLIETYEHIIAFVQKHLPDPFFIEGMERISLRDAIFREVASNILIHREYTNAFPAKLIIERGQVRTENSNKPHGFGVLDPATFTPFPKNPVIGAFFREIHRADELGSGMRKMMRYGKAYGGADPEMIEGDIFRIIVKIPEFGGTSDG